MKRKIMENYTSAKDTYIQRMNQTAKSKFEVIAGYLKPSMKVLDFGSGISAEFIADVESTGAKYVAYDISQTVQTELANMGVDVLADLQNVENEFDIIFMSSVFHEIISYLSRQERTKTLQYVDKALKPTGKLIIRDWGAPEPSTMAKYTISAASEDAASEINIWLDTLSKNSIVGEITVNELEYKGYVHDIYELVFHSVWGLKSLQRESKETYNVTNEIKKWLIQPLGYQIESEYTETDETYLPHLQKYWDFNEMPCPTKRIVILTKLDKNEEM